MYDHFVKWVFWVIVIGTIVFATIGVVANVG